LIARVSEKLKGKCLTTAKTLKQQNTEAATWIADEVIFELEEF
jgi:hypothetical protein